MMSNRREAASLATIVHYLRAGSNHENVLAVERVRVSCYHRSHQGIFVSRPGVSEVEVFSCSGVFWAREAKLRSAVHDSSRESVQKLGPSSTPPHVVAHLIGLCLDNFEVDLKAAQSLSTRPELYG